MVEKDRTAELLEEILKWTKFNAMQLKAVLLEELDADEKKLVYENSDGDRSSRDIAKLANVSYKTVQHYWKSWSEIGIVEATEKYRGGRFKKLCSLVELGIAIPKSSSSSEL